MKRIPHLLALTCLLGCRAHNIHLPSFNDLDELVTGNPISTNFSDTTGTAPELNGYEPQDLVPLLEMPRTPNGGFYLLPGDYEYVAQSYCMHPGTHGPAPGGDGYLFAPLKGPKSEIVRHILERAVSHPEVSQSSIQVLLWAIVARARLGEMGPETQKTALQLLTPEELVELNGGALGLIPQPVLNAAIAKLPPAAQRVIEAQAEIRSLMSQAETAYEDLERVAVLAGEIATGTSSDVPWGQWSKHPDGILIRFMPSHYTNMRVQLHVPDTEARADTRLHSGLWAMAGSSNAPLRQYNPAGGLATPGDQSRQRLIPSGRKHGDDGPIDLARKVTKAPVPIVGAPFPYGAIGFGIPSGLFHYIINWNLNTWSSAAGALGGDPPRSDYTVYAIPKANSIPEVKLGKKISQARAEAISNLAAASMSLSAILQAGAVTSDRLGGAQLAQDSHWSSEQARLLIYLKHEAALAMNRVVEKAGLLFAIMSKEGFLADDFSPDDFAAYQEGLRQHGFPSESLEAARLLQLDAIQLESIRQAQLTLDPHEAAGSTIDMMRRSLEDMQKVAALWSKLPRTPPPWSNNN